MSTTKKSLFQDAVADATSIRTAAFENAKLALEEHFAPKIKKMVDSKLQESLEEEYSEDVKSSEDEVDEAKKKSSEEDKKSSEEHKSSEDESINLEELLKELESDDDEKKSEEEVDESYASEEKDGKKGVKPMDEKTSEEDAKSSEDEIDEEKAQYLALKEKYEGKKKSSEDDKKPSGEEETDFDVDEDIDIDALLKEFENDDEKSSEEKVDEVKYGSEEKDGKKGVKPMDEDLKGLADKLKSGASGAIEDFKKDYEALTDPKKRAEWLQSLSTTLGRIQGVAETEEKGSEMDKVKSELCEANLINSKLLHFGKIVRENNNITKSDKVSYLRQLDKCDTVKEVKLVYGTISESLKSKSKTNSSKKQIKESFGFASNAAGNSTAKKKPLNENAEIVNSDLSNRWAFLAFGK